MIQSTQIKLPISDNSLSFIIYNIYILWLYRTTNCIVTDTRIIFISFIINEILSIFIFKRFAESRGYQPIICCLSGLAHMQVALSTLTDTLSDLSRMMILPFNIQKEVYYLIPQSYIQTYIDL